MSYTGPTLLSAPARPRPWGHPSPAAPWCVCPECGDTAFHLMPERHGYLLIRECMACHKTWTEFASIPRHALREDGCYIRDCDCQREACEARGSTRPTQPTEAR